MDITVYGAAGNVGQRIGHEASACGHNVTMAMLDEAERPSRVMLIWLVLLLGLASPPEP